MRSPGVDITVRLQQSLQARPVKGFALTNSVAGLVVVSLNALPPVLRDRYVDKISSSIERMFEIRPSEILWDIRAKLGILVHPTFLDKLAEGFDKAIEVLPREIIPVLDMGTNKLYFLADEENKQKTQNTPRFSREGLIILTTEQARREMPPIGTAVEIPGGEYKLGDDNGKYNDEKPVHMVEVDPYAIAIFTTTNAQYREAVNGGLYEVEQFWTVEGWQTKEAKGWNKPGCWEVEGMEKFNGDNQPVVRVSHFESFAYLIWKSVQEGVPVEAFLTGKFFDLAKVYDKTNNAWRWPGWRLPTEAEIEIAIRGGQIGLQFPWPEGLEGKAHYNQGNNGTTVEVNDPRFPPNGYGLRHPVGNVWIWGFDLFSGEYYKQLQGAGTVKNPIGPDTGSNRAVRGGSWFNTADYLRVAYRYNNDPVIRSYNLGFRAARTLNL